MVDLSSNSNSLLIQACNPSSSIYPIKSNADANADLNLYLNGDLAEKSDLIDLPDRRFRQDHNLYIDLSEARGDDVVKRLRRTIALSPNRPTLQFLAGAIGSGKTTELLRLKHSLEQQGFVVIYSMADEYLPLGDVRVTEIWILLLYLVTQQMERLGALQLACLPKAIAEIETKLRLNVDIVGDVGGVAANNSSDSDEINYKSRLEKILNFLQKNSQQRFQLHYYLESPLEPQLKDYLLMAAEELVNKEIERLKQMGKKGLVILLDNLDRLSGEQAQQIFKAGAKYLQQFPCHVVYTLLVVSPINNADPNIGSNNVGIGNNSNNSDSTLNLSPHGLQPLTHLVLPLLNLRDRQGEISTNILGLLRQILLARMLPHIEPKMRLDHLHQAFADLETLDCLCIASEGYLPHLISLIYGCWQLQEPPFAMATVTAIVNIIARARK